MSEERSIVMSLSVCFVCLSVCLSGTTCPIFTNFCGYFVWPWIDLSLTVLRYVMYFQFYE